MSFRKRKTSVHYCAPPSIVDVVSDSDETPRNIVTFSPDEYFKKHPVPTEDFSIGEQLCANVPLKEINCSRLLDSSDNLDYNVTEEQVLEKIESITNDASK